MDLSLILRTLYLSLNGLTWRKNFKCSYKLRNIEKKIMKYICLNITYKAPFSMNLLV